MTASPHRTVDPLPLHPRSVRRLCPIRRRGTGERHHFFGYYNKSVWDRTGRYVLGNEVAMMDAPLVP
jgi:hypothetical protein